MQRLNSEKISRSDSPLPDFRSAKRSTRKYFRQTCERGGSLPKRQELAGDLKYRELSKIDSKLPFCLLFRRVIRVSPDSLESKVSVFSSTTR